MTWIIIVLVSSAWQGQKWLAMRTGRHPFVAVSQKNWYIFVFADNSWAKDIKRSTNNRWLAQIFHPIVRFGPFVGSLLQPDQRLRKSETCSTNRKFGQLCLTGWRCTLTTLTRLPKSFLMVKSLLSIFISLRGSTWARLPATLIAMQPMTVRATLYRWQGFGIKVFLEMWANPDLFFVFFRLLVHKFFLLVSRIRTRIVAVEGEDANH